MLGIVANTFVSLPSKQGTNSSKTPKAKHVEKSIGSKCWYGDFACKFRGDDRDDIKDKPSFEIFWGNGFSIFNHKECGLVNEGNKEGEEYVNSKETIDNIVYDWEKSYWFFQ